MLVDGVPAIVGLAPFSTFSVKLSELSSLPSLTVILMPWYLATSTSEGVPAIRPVEVLNVAHFGRFATLKVSTSPFGSLAVGVNWKSDPAITCEDGVPLSVGVPDACLTTREMSPDWPA